MFAYWVEGFRQLFRYGFPQMQVHSAGNQRQATIIVVGRTAHYGGPFKITTEASLFEDSFEFLTHSTRSRLGYLACLPAMWMGTLRKTDGIETWNTKYDGGYAARPATFRLLNRLQKRKPGMHGFYGQDLHWRKQCRDLFTMVDCGRLTSTHILSALRRGDYYGVKGHLKLPSDGQLPSDLVERFEVLQQHSGRMRRIGRRVTSLVKRLAFLIPFSPRSAMRRLF